MSHFIKQCICGKIVAQCRCIGEKSVQILYNCEHEFSTNTNVTVEPLTFVTLEKAYKEFSNKAYLPKTFKCSPQIYRELERVAGEAEIDLLKLDGFNYNKYIQDRQRNPLGTLFGIRVEVDFDMKSGEWEFE